MNQEKQIEALTFKFEQLEKELRASNNRIRILETARRNTEQLIESLKVRIEKAEKRVEAFRTTYIKVVTRLNNIEPHKVEQYLTSIKDRVTELNDGMKASILKYTVISNFTTTLSDKPKYQYSALKGAAMLLDKSQDWWLQRENKTMDDWTVDAIQTEQNHKPQPAHLMDVA